MASPRASRPPGPANLVARVRYRAAESSSPRVRGGTATTMKRGSAGLGPVEVWRVNRSVEVGRVAETSVGATLGRTSLTTYLSTAPSGARTRTSSPGRVAQSVRDICRGARAARPATPRRGRRPCGQRPARRYRFQSAHPRHHRAARGLRGPGAVVPPPAQRVESVPARLPRATIHTTANALTRSASSPVEADPESAVLVEGSTLGFGEGVGVGVGATVGLAVGATVGVAVATATGVAVGGTVEVTGRSTRKP